MWEEKHAEEFDRLIEETETMEFMPGGNVPVGKKATYYNPNGESGALWEETTSATKEALAHGRPT